MGCGPLPPIIRSISGLWALATRTADLSSWLTASEPGDGFGFDYNLAVPEASTWAMMLVGFAGQGFAGYRRALERLPTRSNRDVIATPGLDRGEAIQCAKDIAH